MNDSPQTFTLDGQLFQSSTTTPLLDANALVKVQIINPNGTCLLYEEQQTVNTISTEGYFHINVGSAFGSAKRTANDPGRTMNQIFQNTAPIPATNVTGQTCAGGAYTPAAGAVRYFRIIVTPSATNVADTLTPDLVIDSVPQALVAQSVQGLEKSGILQTATGASLALTQANLEALFTVPAYTNLQAILAGNFLQTDASGATLPAYAATPAGVSAGDIWYDTTTNQIKYQNNAGVQTIGPSSSGISSLTVSSDLSINGMVAGTVSTGAATLDIAAISTPGKVSGNAITSGTISGSAAINTTGNITTNGIISAAVGQSTFYRLYNGAFYTQLTANVIMGNTTFTLPVDAGIAGQVLATDGTGVMSWVSRSSLSTSLDVSGAVNAAGNIKSAGQIAAASKTITGGTATNSIDWNNGNSISTSYGCGLSFTFANLRDGGTYTLAVTDAGTTACTFSTITTGTDAATVTYKYLPTNGARAGTSDTIYTLMRVGNVVYVSWASGFQ